jgi:hydroxymethylpyrimidine pyrophosphatase-like HAD family hydrolase
MKSFSKFVESKSMRLVVYDFDGTLFHSPDREKGSLAYQEATGQPWPFNGWWGRPESLESPVVPSVPTPEWYVSAVVESQRRDMSEPGTTVVLMTGRPYRLKSRVLDILQVQGLRFHDHFFSGQPGSSGSDTLSIKKNHLRRLLGDGVTTLEMWEDRDDQIAGFLAFGEDIKRSRPDFNIVLHDAKKSY